MKIKDFEISFHSKPKLGRFSAKIKDIYRSKDDYLKLRGKFVEELRELQAVLYAQQTHSVLMIFQGMDTSGKDGVIKHVMSGINPQGCQVFSFKKPSDEELNHDFMWRCVKCLPERGKIGIFNRSYYEEVLIARVHPEVLYSEKIPEEWVKANKELWKQRWRDIVNFEDYLTRNGTMILKFFLHISKQEQKERLLARFVHKKKNWKVSAADIEERKYWHGYTRAYEDCLKHTGTKRAPWYVIPANDKKNACLIVSIIILQNLKKLKMNYPVLTKERKEELKTLEQKLLRS